MGARGSVRRMRLTGYSDLNGIFPQPKDEKGHVIGPPGYSKATFQSGKGLLDDLVLIGGLLFRSETATATVYTKNNKDFHKAFKARWKTLVNDCHALNIEICLGLAPQPDTNDSAPFQDWLFASTPSSRAAMAVSIKKAVDEDLSGTSGVSFDCEYLFTNRKTYSQMSEAEKATFTDRRDKLTDFYHQVADVIAPLRAVVITGAKSGHHWTDENVGCSDHSLLHDWTAITQRKNVLLAAMAYMYTPRPPRTFENWHRAVLRYATNPDPMGYAEDRAHIPDEQFQLVVQVAASAANSVGIVTPDETRHRGYLCRLFNNGLGLFPARASSYALADELLNKRPGIRPEAPTSEPANPAPPAGAADQPLQMPIVDPSVAFRKL